MTHDTHPFVNMKLLIVNLLVFVFGLSNINQLLSIVLLIITIAFTSYKFYNEYQDRKLKRKTKRK